MYILCQLRFTKYQQNNKYILHIAYSKVKKTNIYQFNTFIGRELPPVNHPSFHFVII